VAEDQRHPRRPDGIVSGAGPGGGGQSVASAVAVHQPPGAQLLEHRDGVGEAGDAGDVVGIDLDVPQGGEEAEHPLLGVVRAVARVPGR
jgi:hypothetical protein